RVARDVDELVAAFAAPPPPPSAKVAGLPPALDAVVLRALRVDPCDRFPSAQAMLAELELALPPASTEDVVGALESIAFDDLERMKELVARCEQRAGADADPGRAHHPAPPAKGDLFAGRYRIEDPLGSGSMGLVLGARDEPSGASLAIK